MSDSRYEQIISRISEHIRRTLEYCSGVSHDTFMNNSMIQEACIFNVLQTGELAAKAIEYGFDKEHPEIMWRQMRGMRNRIVHNYEGIRLETVWDTINKDFPELLKLLKRGHTMTIRKAVAGDLSRIMDIYHAAQEFMIRSGNPDQWAHIYPTEALVREDIRRGICHVVCDGEAIRGVFALMSGDEPTYQYIEGGAWLNDAPYLTVHRVASDGTAHGIVSCVADYCKGLSDDLRIDTHRKNLPMQRQIEKNGFVRCGTIYVEDGSPRIAYHWTNKA